MKNNRAVLPVIIVLLIIFLPITVFVSFRKFSSGTALENPKKEHKYNNKLFYYDNSKNLIGTYECTSSDCDDALSQIDDETNDFYKEGDKNSIGVFFNDFVFITDNNKTFLYSLNTKKSLLTINMIKNYSSDIEGNYVIIKNDENLYGLFDLNAGNFKIKPEYDYMALANKMKDDKVLSDKIIVKKLNGYYLIDPEDNSLTDTFGVPIYDYNDNVIISNNNGVFTFYKYNGESLLSDLTIVKYELISEYIVLTDNNNSIYIYNSKTGVVDKNYVTVDNDSISYEINDNKIIIKNNGTEFDSYEIKSN